MTPALTQSKPAGANQRAWFSRTRLLRKHLIFPPEHGAWIWLAGPFVVGAVAGEAWSSDIVLSAAAALAAFFARQPATLLVKILKGRRSRRELGPVLFWLVADGGLAGVLATWLALRGYTQILWVALPALAVLGWTLWLTSRRAERGQTGVQIVAAGVLSLTAPAGYWAAAGSAQGLPWLLWGVMWFQAAASIVLVRLRLTQRSWSQAGSLSFRMAKGWRALLYNGFNGLAAVVGWAVFQAWSGWLVLGFSIMLVDTLDSVLRPPLGSRPSAVGIRQGISSAIFVALAALGFALA